MATPFHLIWFTTSSPRNWDLPDNENYHWKNHDTAQDMAQVLETRGKFDALVFADSDGIATVYGNTTDHYVKYGLEMVGKGDPLPVFSAIAARTKHLGLVPTLSSTFFTPQLLAQAMGTLDHLSNGRSGWNIVTSVGQHNAQNYGMDDLPEGNERYDHAEELVGAVENLWATTRDSSVTDDGFAGLRMPPLPQGKSVYMQAGGSERGREFAARHAEIIITHSHTVPAMKAYRDDLRARMVRIGRDPDSCKIFFTVKPVIAETREEAEELYSKLKRRPALSVESGLVNFASRIGLDVSQLPLDEPFPTDLIPQLKGSIGQLQQHLDDGRSPTMREIGQKEAVKESYLALGSPAEVADQLATDMETIGGDGFAIRESLHPSNVIPVVDLLVPVLQQRGLVRTEYRHGTFRENLLDPDFNRPLHPNTADGK